MRVNIQDLLLGKGYAAQVRANSGDKQSQWSPVFNFATITDTTVPATPTSVTWVSSSDTFHAEWTPVTKNTNNDTVPITRYEVEVTGGTTVRVVSVTPNTGDTKVVYDLSFEDNRSLFNAIYPSVKLRVRAVDNKEGKSDWSSSLTATNPAPTAPTNAVVSVGVDNISISWTISPDKDVSGYNVYTGTSSTFTPSSTNLLWSGNASKFAFTTTTYSVQYFKIRAIDKFGQESTDLACSGKPNTPYVADTTAPSTPTNLAGSITNNASGLGAIAALSWTAASASDLQGYYVRYRKVGGSTYSSYNVDKSTTSVNISLDTAYTNYEFQIASYDFSANQSSWSSTVTLTSPANAAPGAVSGLTGKAGADSIAYSWTQVTDNDLRNYEVTFSTSSTFASGNTTYLTGTSAALTVSGLSNSTTYYARVRSVDTAGLTSAWSSTVSVTTLAYPTTALTDGYAPKSSPTPTVAAGIGYIYANWVAVTQNSNGGNQLDPVTYEIHLSTTSDFTPSSSTKLSEVSGTFALIDFLPVTSTPLSYGTTYYIKLIAKDRDGAAAAGNQGSASPAKVASTDSNLVASDVGAPTTAQLNQTNTNVSTAQSTANSKVKTFYQSTTPTAVSVGDIWIDTGNGNILKIASATGTANWSAYQDSGIASANTAAGNAQTTADSKARVYYQSSAPSTNNSQDLWIDITGNANTPKRYNGSAWVAVTDKVATDAASLASLANNTANTKAATFVQSATPTAANTNDIWIDTGNGNAIKTWNGSAWVINQIGPNGLNVIVGGGNLIVDSSFENQTPAQVYTHYANTVFSTAYSYQGSSSLQLTGTNEGNDSYIEYESIGLKKNTTYTISGWFYITDNTTKPLNSRSILVYNNGGGEVAGLYSPTLNLWTRTSLTFTTANDGAVRYRLYSPQQGTIYWDAIQLEEGNIPTSYSPSVQDGINKASVAQGTADNKNTTFVQSTAPSALKAGDVWIDTSHGNVINVASAAGTGSWSTYQDTSIAANASTANQALTTANGKNKVIYSSSVASGGTANGYVAGDIWFQRDANNNIIGQWQFNGSSFVQQYISDSVISNLNVGKLVSGSIASTDITLGANGYIRSTDYSAGTAGWRLGTGGLEINSGIVRASALNITVGGGNILSNSNAADGMNNWAVSGGVTSVSSTEAAIYNKTSFKVTSTTSNADQFVYTQLSIPGFPLPNTKYTLSAWMNCTSYNDSASAHRALLLWDGNTSVDNVTLTGVTNGWVRKSVTFTTSANPAYIHARLYGINGTVYWGGVQLELGDVATSYAPKADEILPGTIAGNMLQTNLAFISQLTINSGGYIRSSLYTSSNGSQGFQINDTGVIIKSGSVDANLLSANTTITNNLGVTGVLTIGSGGSVQSSNYNGSNTGYIISNNGISMLDANSKVSAAALQGGTISATSAIVLGPNANLIVNGGSIRSNTYTAGSAGFSIGTSGIELNDTNSKVSANTFTAGTISSATINLSTSGVIQTSGYNGTSGFQLSGSGVTIPTGNISAAALRIQPNAENLILPEFADFESNNYTNRIVNGNTTYALSTSLSQFNSQSLQVTTTSGSGFIWFGGSTTSGDSSPAMLNAQATTYIVSWYAYLQSNNISLQPILRYSGSTDFKGAVQTITGAAWNRYYTTITVTGSVSNRLGLYFAFSGDSGAVVNLDGIQIEEQASGLAIPSTWTPPGYTAINGAQIRTGAIVSNTSLDGSTTPAWFINTSGAASFQSLQVLGNAVVGTAGSDSVSQIASAGYSSGSAGWRIRAYGDAEFNNVTVRGNIQGNSSSVINGGTLTGASINGGTMTGALIQTNSDSKTGIKLDSNAFNVYNGSINVLNISAANGNIGTFGTINVIGSGVLRATSGTDQSGARIEIASDAAGSGNQGGGVIRSYCGVTNESPGKFNPYLESDGSASVRIVSGTVPNFTESCTVSVRSGTTGNSLINLNSSLLKVGGTMNGTAANFSANVHGNNLFVDSLTGSSTRALYIASGGALTTTSSTRRVKKNIEPLDIPVSTLLKLEPVQFNMKDETDTHLYAGFIAEDLAELGLDHWVWYDDEGLPGGINYAEMTSGLMVVIKDQESRLQRLEKLLLTTQE